MPRISKAFQPKVIYYSAAEESRADLYEFLTKRIQNHAQGYRAYRVQVPNDPRAFFVLAHESVGDDVERIMEETQVPARELTKRESVQ